MLMIPSKVLVLVVVVVVVVVVAAAAVVLLASCLPLQTTTHSLLQKVHVLLASPSARVITRLKSQARSRAMVAGARNGRRVHTVRQAALRSC